MKYHAKAFWSEYQDRFWKENGDGRFGQHIQLMQKYGPYETALELGANQGFFSMLMSKYKVVTKTIFATDYDSYAVNCLYEHIKNMKLPTMVLPGVLDVEELNEKNLDEYQADIVIANALVHHLLIGQHMNIKWLVKMLAGLTKKDLIVEFMPRGLWTKNNNLRPPKWYSEDWFVKELETRFEILDVQDTDESRRLYFARKR